MFKVALGSVVGARVSVGGGLLPPAAIVRVKDALAVSGGVKESVTMKVTG